MFDLTNSKLITLAEFEGYSDPMDLIEDYVHDSIVPAICTNPTCDQTAETEPDQRAGCCESCGQKSVQSALVIAGFI